MRGLFNMVKLKRPTLATTENCIKLLRELEADFKRCKNPVQEGFDSEFYLSYNHHLVKMVLAMLSNDEEWLEDK